MPNLKTLFSTILIIFIGNALTCNAFAMEIFIEALYGHSVSYNQEMVLTDSSQTSSEFSGTTTALRIGFFSKTWAFSLEHKPTQEISVGNDEQVAEIGSSFLNIEYALFLGKTYMVGAGVFSGNISYELIQGSDGTKYKIPPKASGSTYGTIFSIRFQLSDHVHIGVEYKNGQGEVGGVADASTGAESINIPSFSESSAFMGYTF